MVLFITLYKVALTFDSVDEILKCDHSNESYSALMMVFIILYKVVLTFESVVEIKVTLTWMFQTVLIGSQPEQEVPPSLPEL